ncbi:MAG TPA: 30S ribosomal protein S21 [Bacteroidales bacterium]|nr:30S ribosomal protein S21 [Bacteroidales bacterium]
MSKCNGVGIKLYPGESIDSALRRYKTQLERSGILDIMQRKEYYLKPSAAKKAKKALRRKEKEYVDNTEEFYNE